MDIKSRFEACILGGAIGDAWGSGFENMHTEPESTKRFYLFGKPPVQEPGWQITDDTQLTLATCEALVEDETANPETIVKHFVRLFRKRNLIGMGASTLQALRELDMGGHWSQVGRKGDYAAGNGAAMRIAPLAFFEKINRTRIREICWITHQNDEAYTGALAVVMIIREIISKNPPLHIKNIIENVMDRLPDTKVRDRLIEINSLGKSSLEEIAQLGNDGYVVNSVPLAINAASRVDEMGIENMFKSLIEIGGDTDTNCSIAGQIAGACLGKTRLPNQLLEKLQALDAYTGVETIIETLVQKYNW